MLLFTVLVSYPASTYTRIVPIAANNPEAARLRVKYLLRDTRILVHSALEFEPTDRFGGDEVFAMIESLEGEWCEYCQDNDHISDSVFNEGIKWINQTFDAYYNVCE